MLRKASLVLRQHCLRPWGRLLIGTTLLLALLPSVVNWLQSQGYINTLMPLRYVRLQGEFNQLDPRRIKHEIAPVIEQQGMLAALGDLRESLLEVPWVADVKLNRVWPDTLVIDLNEEQVVARWRNDGLITPNGDVFFPDLVQGFDALPLIVGPLGWQERLYSSFSLMDKKLKPFGVSLRVLEVSDRLAWTVKLSSGMEVKMGRVEKPDVFVQWLDILPKLSQVNIDAMESVDLRYPNGFAVRWKADSKMYQKQVLNRSKNGQGAMRGV